MTRLLLVRHGESEGNLQGIFAAQINPALTERGLMQAELTADFIAENYSVDSVYASDLSRASVTAECIAKRFGLPVSRKKDLREIDGGEWEGVPFKDLESRFGEAYRIWMEDIKNAVCTGGESVRQVLERTMASLTEIAEENEGKTVVVVAHATPIRVAQAYIQTGGIERIGESTWVTNASVSEYQYEDKKWCAIAISMDRHLEALKTALPSDI